MKKSKKSIIIDHQAFASEMRDLLDKYQLKFNTSTVSLKNDPYNRIVITMYKENFILPQQREWHDY